MIALDMPTKALNSWALSSIVLCILALFYRRWNGAASSSKRLPLPPGPKPLPILGNLLDVPTRDLGRSFHKISEKYGDVTYLTVPGHPMVILDSYDAACALLENHSAETSGRPSYVMAELTGFSPWEFALFGDTQAWRRHRRAFHKVFHKGAIVQYQPVQLEQIRKLLRKLVSDPEDFVQHFRLFFGATIMRLVYGIGVEEQSDKYISLVERGAFIFTTIMIPGRFLVEAIPLLRHLPSWLPGARFKREAAVWKGEVEAMRDVPYNVVVREIKEFSSRPSILSRMLGEINGSADKSANTGREEVCRNVAAIAYLTGADTTFSSVQAFVLAMAMHPDVQRKAQAELDSVIGPERLPDFSDRPALPYINAIAKECFRWLSVVPLGVPHLVSEDIELDGYLIPKGAVLVPNAWAMSRDPVAYPDPEEFKPERFLPDASRDPQKYFFGFGRRICAGRHFADASLFIVVASVLHTLNIEPPLDDAGQPMQLEARFTKDLFLSYPEPFSCKITPRSNRAKE